MKDENLAAADNNDVDVCLFVAGYGVLHFVLNIQPAVGVVVVVSHFDKDHNTQEQQKLQFFAKKFSTSCRQ